MRLAEIKCLPVRIDFVLPRGIAGGRQKRCVVYLYASGFFGTLPKGAIFDCTFAFAVGIIGQIRNVALASRIAIAIDAFLTRITYLRFARGNYCN